MLPIHVILHPTDFAENTKPAFELACALARDYGAKLVIFHALPTPVLPAFEGAVYPVSMEIPRAEALDELDAIEPRDPSIVVERVLVEGEPAFEILRAAGGYEADLIIMGTHGRGGLRRFLMGSVAEEVSRKATCPVLTVRTKAAINAEKSAATEHAEPVEVR